MIYVYVPQIRVGSELLSPIVRSFRCGNYGFIVNGHFMEMLPCFGQVYQEWSAVIWADLSRRTTVENRHLSVSGITRILFPSCIPRFCHYQWLVFASQLVGQEHEIAVLIGLCGRRSSLPTITY